MVGSSIEGRQLERIGLRLVGKKENLGVTRVTTLHAVI